MKQFFENYGGIALGILALLVLIAMITPVGNIIKTSLQGTVSTFSTKMNSQTDTMSESMNEIMTDIAGYRGTVGSKLSDVQYKYLKDHYSEWHNDHTIIFLGISQEGLYNDPTRLIIMDISTKRIFHESADIYRQDCIEIYPDGSTVNTVRHSGLIGDYSKFIYNSQYARLETTVGHYINTSMADSCETLNLGCEVS